MTFTNTHKKIITTIIYNERLPLVSHKVWSSQRITVNFHFSPCVPGYKLIFMEHGVRLVTVFPHGLRGSNRYGQHHSLSIDFVSVFLQQTTLTICNSSSLRSNNTPTCQHKISRNGISTENHLTLKSETGKEQELSLP